MDYIEARETEGIDRNMTNYDQTTMFMAVEDCFYGVFLSDRHLNIKELDPKSVF